MVDCVFRLGERSETHHVAPEELVGDVKRRLYAQELREGRSIVFIHQA
jgi:hypothetical protein